MNKIYLNSKLLSLRFPLSAFKFYRGKKESFQKKILKKAFIWSHFSGQTSTDFENYWNEIVTQDFVPLNSSKLKTSGNTLSSTFGKWMYMVLRATKPEILVETGVSHGYSSWLILNAIKKNGKGKLYSIDLAGNDTNSDYNLSQEKIGHVVSEELRINWELIIGDVAQKLPELLGKLQQIDLFFHDSDHSYKNMQFEFKTANQFLKKNGIILSDDIHKNAAFEEFVNQNKLKTAYFTKGGMCFKA